MMIRRLDSWAVNGTGGVTKHVILCHVSRRQISSPGLGSTQDVYEIFFLSNEIYVRMIRYEMVLGIDLIDLIVFLIILIDCSCYL